MRWAGMKLQLQQLCTCTKISLCPEATDIREDLQILQMFKIPAEEREKNYLDCQQITPDYLFNSCEKHLEPEPDWFTTFHCGLSACNQTVPPSQPRHKWADAQLLRVQSFRHAMFLFSTAEHAFYLMTSSAVNQTERVSLCSVIWFHCYSDQTWSLIWSKNSHFSFTLFRQHHPRAAYSHLKHI